MVAWRNIEKATLEPVNMAAANAVLADLKGQVAGLETQTAAANQSAEMLSTGVTEIDRSLPWGGLPTAGLHEVAGWHETDMALALIRRLLARQGEIRPVIWCQAEDVARERGRLYGPGLILRGLDPSRLIFITARREREALWAMEEALASGAAAGAVGEIPALGMTETRRLQLAAAKGGAMGLILRGPIGDRAPSAALTRWRAEPCPDNRDGTLPGLPGPSRFDLSLWRVRGGRPANWHGVRLNEAA